ncbi:ATP-binding protein [Embleya sp. NPDC005971]|uniref:ATP-binding protein n=1 Tax=Embleya sp. NPDC005971 TaxID=3156724 RepID=UPI0033C14FBC
MRPQPGGVQSRRPPAQTAGGFDFDRNPNVLPETVGDLKSTSWVRDDRPLVLIGDSGTAESHLLIGVGTAIAEAGLSVRYTTTSALVNELAEADAARPLSSVIGATARSISSARTSSDI